nr:YebC/PmpR family DNA-binding transcriptional regulator [Patescibacteria group bacterium]
MSGHSKWATTHRQKAVIDSQRSKEFSKLSRLITVAARQKGGDISSNFSLRMLVEKAKDCSMPKDNIDKAIKKGIGEDGDENFEELIYEAIGPYNTQFIVKCLTSNKNRTANDIRWIFSRNGGAFSSVMWNFEQRGAIEIYSLRSQIKNYDDFELEIIENGGIDIAENDNLTTIYTDIKDLQNLSKFLESKNIKIESAEIRYIPKETV